MRAPLRCALACGARNIFFDSLRGPEAKAPLFHPSEPI
jgi:hypothetical protein